MIDGVFTEDGDGQIQYAEAGALTSAPIAPAWSGCCATARGPFAVERLEQVADDRLVYRLPKPQPEGRTELRLTRWN